MVQRFKDSRDGDKSDTPRGGADARGENSAVWGGAFKTDMMDFQ